MDLLRYEEICAYLRSLIKDTKWEGKVYAVGGCCRDMIMGREIHDIDLAVNLPNGGIEFAEYLHHKKLTVGKPLVFPRFGTARTHLKRFPADEIELVQTRKEKYTDKNSANPSTAFGTISDDCFRRDLTINSLYQNISTGEILDLTGKGIDDIRNQVIRTPSSPDITFDDDPLRILRCIRFANKYGWNIQPETYEAMLKNVPRLSIVSPDRARGEFEKMLMSDNPAAAFGMLKETGALAYFMPELMRLDFPYDRSGMTVWEHTMEVLSKMPPSLPLRLAALLHDVGMEQQWDASAGSDGHEMKSQSLVKPMLRRLKVPTETIHEAAFLVRNHNTLRDAGAHGQDLNPRKLRRLQFQCGTPERFESLLTLIDADNRFGADAGRLAQQVEAVRVKSDAFRDAGTDMFGYKLPVSEKDIRRIKRISSPAALTRCKNHLMKQAYLNPARSREEFISLLRAYSPPRGKK